MISAHQLRREKHILPHGFTIKQWRCFPIAYLILHYKGVRRKGIVNILISLQTFLQPKWSLRNVKHEILKNSNHWQTCKYTCFILLRVIIIINLNSPQYLPISFTKFQSLEVSNSSHFGRRQAAGNVLFAHWSSSSHSFSLGIFM